MTALKYIDRFLIALIGTLLTSGSMNAAEVWPDEVVRYDSKLTTETLETADLDRILLIGPRDIQMDLLDGMTQVENPERYSVAFTSPYNSLVKFGLSVFKANSFSPILKQETMLRYLSNLSKQALKDEDDSFEILMEPEPDGGRTFFRFLNTKPFTVRYAYTTETDDKQVRMIRQESWALLEGNYYVATIEAPEKNFDSFLATVKQPAGSMHFIDS